jgi:hypothetical protein
MAIRISSAAANDMADALLALIDGGAGAGKLKVYTGSLGSDLDATGDTLLATFTLTDPAGSVSGNVLTLDFDPDISATVAASGTAGYFHITDSNDVVVLGGTVGTSGADLNFAAVAWTSGGTVSLATGTITVPLA